MQNDTPQALPILEQSLTPFDDMDITSLPLGPDTLRSTNAALNDYLNIEKPVNTLIRQYIKSLTLTSKVFSAEVAMLNHECNTMKEVLQTRKQQKTGKQFLLDGQISLSQPELCQSISDMENAKQTKRSKKTKKSIKKNDMPLQSTSEDEEEQVLLSEIEVIGY
jgi:hypothetical protein